MIQDKEKISYSNTTRQVGSVALELSQKSAKKFTKLHRVGLISAGVMIMVVSLLIQNLGPLIANDIYDLAPETLRLTGEVREDAAQNLKINAQQTAYEFALPEKEVSSSESSGRVEDAYSANFSVQANEGVSITDKSTKVTVKLTPKFNVSPGKKVAGNQIVYPFGKNQLVYSLKYDGVKEDIIVPEYIESNLTYDFELALPSGVEAKLESNGEIGIYTAESLLYGEVSYGSDEDRELVEKAKARGEKNNRIAIIPAPIVKDSTGKEYTDKSRFILSEAEVVSTDVSNEVPAELQQKVSQDNKSTIHTLTIESHSLDDLQYPISIDPTYRVTSAADFADITFDGGVEIDNSNGLIRRGSSTGGTIASWSSTTNLPTDMLAFSAVAYNSYIYLIGGDRSGGGAGTGSDVVNYAKINTNGTFAANSGCGTTWCTTSSLNTGRRTLSGFAHNGYLYALGGNTSGATYINTVEYAKINANGTLGSWAFTSNMLSDRSGAAATAVDNYIYLLGGNNSSFAAGTDNSEYARLDANGAIASDSGCGSSWCTNGALPTRRVYHGVKAYDNWIYLVGGRWGSTLYDTSYFAHINGDGTLGSWTQTTSMNSNRYGQGLEIWNGYMYATGGCSTYAGSGECQAGFFLNTTEYTPILANGSLGTWRSTDSFTTGSLNHGSSIWNGYIYVLGGCISGICQYTNRSQIASIDSAGALHDGSWDTTTGFTTGRRYPTVEVHNGCMYVIAGWDSSGGGYLDTVQYATINTDGTVGSWTTSGNTLATARRNHQSVIYGGYLYVAGGWTGAVELDDVEYAPINADCSIGAFTTDTDLLLDARQSFGLAAYNGYLYSTGGNSSSGDEVAYSAINSADGSIGTWSIAGSYTDLQFGIGALHIHNGYMYLVGGRNGAGDTYYGVRYAAIESDGTLPSPGGWNTATPFTTGRTNFSSVIHNGYMYIMGGEDSGSTALDDVQLAPINADGSIGTWSYTVDLNDTRTLFDAVSHGGYLYVVGGTDGATNNSNTVSYKAINNGGSGGPVTFSSGSLYATGRKNHTAVAHDGYIYVLGGCITATVCTTATNNISFAALNSDGSVGSWSDVTTNFTSARRDHHAWVLNGRMYIAGGRDAGGSSLTDIQYADIGASGDISGSWTTDGTSFPNTGYGPGVTLNENVLYVLGGTNSGGDDSWYAEIDYDSGDVGSFTSTTILPEGRLRAWTIVYKGYIYAIGGYDGSDYLHSVLYAPLNPDNTIGTWQIASSQLNEAMGYLTSGSVFALNGYIYIAGGGNASPHGSIDYAAIGSGGDLGDWQRGNSTGLTSHGDFAVAQYDGIMYTTGGQYSGFDPSRSSRYAVLQSIPRVGSFSKAYDFENGVRPEKVVTNGVKQTDAELGFKYSTNEDCDDSIYGNTQSSSDIGVGASNAANIDIGSDTLVRCMQIRYTIDDSKSSVFPDTDNESSIYNFDAFFISNPGSRLRGGRSFTNGVDRGLTANPEKLGAKLLTSGLTDSNLTSYTTNLVAPNEDRVLLLGVVYALSGSSNPPPPSSVTGLGLTWVLIASESESTSSTAREVAVYRAQTSSSPPTPGSISINFASTQTMVGWSLEEFSGVALGNNGADAVGTIDTDSTNSTTINLDLGHNVANSFTIVFWNTNVPSNPTTGPGSVHDLKETVNAPSTLWETRYSSTGEREWMLEDGGTTRKAAVGVRLIP